MWAKAKKAAEYYDVSVRTVRTWQREGILPFVRVNNTVLFDLDAGDQQLREKFTIENDTAAVVDELIKDLT